MPSPRQYSRGRRESILDCVMCGQPASNTPISVATGLCMPCAEIATRRQPQQKRDSQ